MGAIRCLNHTCAWWYLQVKRSEPFWKARVRGQRAGATCVAVQALAHARAVHAQAQAARHGLGRIGAHAAIAQQVALVLHQRNCDGTALLLHLHEARYCVS